MQRHVVSAMTVAVAIFSVSLGAQKTTELGKGDGGSPHVKSEWTIDGAKISITYGRPSLKGRTPGKDIEPMDGKPWRTGADEATLITTDKPLKIGTLNLAPGTYTLNTQADGPKWQLIVGKLGKPGQWGIPYQQALETGRAPMTVGKAAAPAETLTISLQDTPAGGTLKIDWGVTSASVPFTVG
jgi:Protein of unknown function (DUF2911)